VNAATATLYGAIIAGTFALLGVVIERLLRSTGRVRCEASLLFPLRLTGVEKEPGYPRDVPPHEADEAAGATGVSYHCAVDLFNGKEVPTGLRDIAVVFIDSSGKRFLDHPDNPESARRTSAGTFIFDRLAILNLQPLQFKRLEMRGEFGKDAANALLSGRWERIVFEAQRPKRPFFGILGSKTYRETIINSQEVPG
jgi:hypothetical protein